MVNQPQLITRRKKMTNDDPQETATPVTESVAAAEVVNEESISAAAEIDETDAEPTTEAAAGEENAEEE
jgi:hypothetical protein